MSPAMLARISILERLDPDRLSDVIANAERVIADQQSIIAAAKKARKNQRAAERESRTANQV